MTGHHLDVGAGHRVWWNELGTPEGTPVVVLHGGPGSGTSPGYLTWCDPARQRIVLMDQRNSGRSTPHASLPSIDLGANTTAHLIADLERLRALLGIERWMVLAASWGTTLALAYGLEHPEAISGMVLVSTVTTSSTEVEWITRGMALHFPAPWQRFVEALPREARDGNLAAAYHALLMDPDPQVHGPAARAWCAWEETHVATDGRPASDSRYADPGFRLCFARIVTHYWANHAFLPDGKILQEMDRLAGIPAVLIHGQRDLSSPVSVASAIHASWPGSTLRILTETGHGAPSSVVREAAAEVCRRAQGS